MRCPIFVLSFVIITSPIINAQPLVDGNYLIPVDHVWGIPKSLNLKAIYQADYYPILGVLYNGYYILEYYLEHEQPLVYTDHDYTYGDNGYCYSSHGYSDSIEPLILLHGGDTVIPVGKHIYAQPDQTFNDKNWSDLYLEGGPRKAYALFSTPNKVAEYNGEWREGPWGLWDDGIASINVWSTLVEKIKGEAISYDATRMRFPFYHWGDMELNFNNSSLFWAEGDTGSGIGGTIDVTFKRKTDHVMILNGAVDLSRLNLYMDNNRLRRIRVDGDNGAFSMEYIFEDHVKFHKISLPKEASKIRITILDVYKGRKWDDTCVTAIFLKQPPLRPRSEYDKVIKAYIMRKGFDKLIEEYEKKK